MTTQKEIDEMFIGLLGSISQICNKTTYVNLSRNIAAIKGKCIDLLQFYKKYPANPWHSVKDGDLPPFNKPCLFNCNGTTYIGFVRGDESLYLENNLDLSLSINDINYWMEIHELPTC